MRPEHILDQLENYWGSFWTRQGGTNADELMQKYHLPIRPGADWPTLTIEDVQGAIHGQANGKSSGPDGWRVEELTLCGDMEFKALTAMYQRWEREAALPDNAAYQR
eukprot:441778-Amphidinium_carterae.1